MQEAQERAERKGDPAWDDYYKRHDETMRQTKLVPVYALVARFEAILRVYKDPLPYVMRVRQMIAAEQGRLANVVCTKMLIPAARLVPHLVSAVDELFDDSYDAVKRLCGRPPPIVCA